MVSATSFSALQHLTPIVVCDPLVLPPQATVQEAIAHMSRARLSIPPSDGILTPLESLHREARTSCVAVVDDNTYLGLLTERDLLCHSTQAIALNQLLQQVVPAHSPTLRLAAITNCAVVENLFLRHPISHLPVLEAEGQLVGFITRASLYAGLHFTQQQITCPTSSLEVAQHALQQQRDFNLLIAEITSRFVSLDPDILDVEIERTLQLIGEATQVDTCYLMHCAGGEQGLPPEACTFSMTHEWSREGCPRHLPQVQNLPMAAFPWCFPQILRQEVIHVPNVMDLPPEAATDRQNWQRFNLRSVLSVPLVQKNRVMGMMGFASFTHPMIWSEESIRLLRVMGQAIANLQDRIQTEQDLHESEARLRLALAAANQGLYDLNLQTGEAVVSSEYAQMLGYEPIVFQETNADWLKRLHPEDRDRVAATYQAYLAGVIPEYRVEFRQQMANGHYKWILSLGKIVARSEDGMPLRMMGTHTDIDERKQAELSRIETQQMRNELRILESILDIILAGYWDWDIPNDTEYLSPGFKRMFGYAEHELPNKPESWQKIIFQEDLPGVMACFERHIQSRGAVPFYNEVRYHHKDGSTVWVICSGQVISWDGEGNPLRMIGCHIDITRRKETEAELQKTKEEFENFFLVSLDLLCIADLDGRFRRLNRSWETTLGYTVTELEGKSFLDLVHPEDRDATLQAIAHLGHQQQLNAFVNRYRCKDGSYCYIEWYSKPHGSLIYAAARDVTAHRATEQYLRKNEAHLKAAQRISQLGSWEFEVLTGAITWSDEVFRIFGLDPAQGPPSYEELLQLYLPGDRDRHAETVEWAIAHQQPYDLECRAWHADGSLLYVQARGEPIFDAEGRLVQLVGTVQDITERKLTEERLRLLSDRLTLALQAGAIGTWDWDLVSAAVWDDRMYEIYGLQGLNRPVTYQDWVALLHPEDREYVESALAASIQGTGNYDVEFRIVRPDGELRWVRATALLQRDTQGCPLRMTGLNQDITDQKLTEVRLKRSAVQLEASNRELEAFAYSVSHDLRSPLRAIDGFSKALLEDYGTLFDADAQDYFNRIRHNIKRMGLLIDDLLRLSRVSRSEMQYTTVNLSELVAEEAADLQAADPDRTVEFVIMPGAIAQADLTLMRVVITNLLQNAWKFTSHHPTARIEFGQLEQDGQLAYFIQDDGAGFDMAFTNMLFGVFQRLHNTNEFPGTGIGLATVQRAIHRHGGRVWAHGYIEQGATFYFTLPTPSAPVKGETA